MRGACRFMRRVTWWVCLLALCLLVVAGCGSGPKTAAPVAAEAGAGKDPAMLTSGKFSMRYGTLHIGREIVVYADGRILDRRETVATDEFAKTYRQMRDVSPQGWKVTRKDEDGKVVITLEREYPSIKEFNADKQDQREGTVEEVSSLLFHKVSFQATVQGYGKDAVARAFGGHPQATAEDWVSFLERAVTYGVKVTLPERITRASEGALVDPGTTLEWKRAMGDIGANSVRLVVESKKWGWGAWAAGGGLLLLAGGPLLIRATRKYWDPEDVE